MKSLKVHTGMSNETQSCPQISLVFPFELKMNQQLSLTDMLTLAADNEEKKLTSKYPEERVEPIMKKLRHLIEGIHCRQDKMSLCILVSPLTEKVFYFSPTNGLSNYFPVSKLDVT
ncbi:MAG TPA: hypothetical protein VMU83_14325 [Hanamia sp.]|nr:hypothetical protein [Hanamia sp.]